MSRRILSLLLLSATACISPANAADVSLQFDQVDIGKPVPAWTNNGVVFSLSRKPAGTRAVGRIMFFPHLNTDHKGILNAMANETIPVQIHFPNGASSVTLKLWGSIENAALVEALDDKGEVVDKATLAKVPQRSSPADPIPSFELTVKAANIASVRFGGNRPGGYIAAEEVRFTPLPAQTNAVAPSPGSNAN